MGKKQAGKKGKEEQVEKEEERVEVEDVGMVEEGEGEGEEEMEAEYNESEGLAGSEEEEKEEGEEEDVLEMTPDIMSAITDKIATIVIAVESAFGHSPDEYVAKQMIPSLAVALKELLRAAFLRRDYNGVEDVSGRERISPIRFVAHFLKEWRRAQRTPAMTSKRREVIIKEVAEVAVKKAWKEDVVEDSVREGSEEGRGESEREGGEEETATE